MPMFKTPDFRAAFIEKYRNARLLDLGCGATGVDYVPFPGAAA